VAALALPDRCYALALLGDSTLVAGTAGRHVRLYDLRMLGPEVHEEGGGGGGGAAALAGQAREGSMKPIDMAQRLSRTHTGCHPEAACRTSLASTPIILGALGPQMSMSSSPVAPRPPAPPPLLRSIASCEASVDLPTPPFPLSTSTL
jgi:hypothetical protein